MTQSPAPSPAAALAAIEHALATGELEVEFADRRVKYRSVAELLAAADYWRARLQESGLATGLRPSVGVAVRAMR